MLTGIPGHETVLKPRKVKVSGEGMTVSDESGVYSVILTRQKPVLWQFRVTIYSLVTRPSRQLHVNTSVKTTCVKRLGDYPRFPMTSSQEGRGVSVESDWTNRAGA
jgi:hypothetical protein